MDKNEIPAETVADKAFKAIIGKLLEAGSMADVAETIQNFTGKTLEELQLVGKTLAEIISMFSNAIEDFLKEIRDFFCEKEEIEEIGAHFKPCLSMPLPPRTYRSFKLWRKNRALFRPYKRNI